jgi:hypothetical protein
MSYLSALRALVDALPRCLGEQCRRPATMHDGWDEARFCDEHAPKDEGYEDFYYGPALREAIREVEEGP